MPLKKRLKVSNFMKTEPLRYSMYIQWSEEDQAYIVTVLELPGCKTHGKTYVEAVKQGQDAIRYPSLVVEVLSPATEARDRGEKSLQYRSCPSIQEILLINAQFPIIELFRREKHGFWALYTLQPGDTVQLTSLGSAFLCH